MSVYPKGGTKCPFDTYLLILNKNKEKVKIELSTDTCSVFKSGESYYDYRYGGGSELLYSLFGLNREQVYKLTHNYKEW